MKNLPPIGVVVPIRDRPDIDASTGKSTEIDGEFSGELSGGRRPSSRHALLEQFRHETPARWMAFCRAHFSGPQEVWLFFGCDEKTGRNYWNGVGRPTLDKALVAETEFPEGYQTYMIAAE